MVSCAQSLLYVFMMPIYDPAECLLAARKVAFQILFLKSRSSKHSDDDCLC